MKFKFALIGFFIVLTLFSSASAEIPRMINYQGKLTDSLGALIDTSVSIRFFIYQDSIGGIPLWIETQDPVRVDQGIFSVLLGSLNGIPDSVFNGGIRYLGIKVGDDPQMTPRKPIVSVAYAYKSIKTDTADYAVRGPGVGDNDWDLRITDTADTALITVGKWGIARSGNVLYGNADSTHVNLGVSCTTGSDGNDYKYCTVTGGAENTASGNSATVGGGYKNTASGWRATVGGGYTNAASGDFATVAGGDDNTASGNRACVGGGVINTASGFRATVGGGYSNTASGSRTVIGGGHGNTAGGDYAAVGGGRYNNASGYIATIPGGFGDTVSGDYSFASGSLVRINPTADYTFAFGNDFSTSTPHAVVFFDAITETRVGIQITDPTNILTVQQNSITDPIADSWTIYSSKECKRDIRELGSEEYREALKRLVSVPLVRFHYKGEDIKEKIGILAEQAPEEILAEGDNGAISLNEYVSLLHAALKAQQQEIEIIRAKLNRLESNLNKKKR